MGELQGIDLFHSGMALLRWVDGRPEVCENFPALKNELIEIALALLERATYGTTEFGYGYSLPARPAGSPRDG